MSTPGDPALPMTPVPGGPALGSILPAGGVCVPDDGCITCGDVAVPLRVVAVAGSDARCRDRAGREEIVALELVGAVQPGDGLLVHAGVALERLDGLEEW